MKSLAKLALISFLMFTTAQRACGQAPFAEESPAKTALREAIFRHRFKAYVDNKRVAVLCISRTSRSRKISCANWNALQLARKEGTWLVKADQVTGV